MTFHQSMAPLAWIGALLVLFGFHLAGGCGWNECPEPEPFESGDYTIVGLTYSYIIRPEDQWVIDTVTGANVSVDRDAGEVTIQYTKDGATYLVHYTIED